MLIEWYLHSIWISAVACSIWILLCRKELIEEGNMSHTINLAIIASLTPVINSLVALFAFVVIFALYISRVLIAITVVFVAYKFIVVIINLIWYIIESIIY